MNKYRFTFSEINYGSIVIESDHKPTEGEIIDRIMSGEADYRDTDFDDFELVEIVPEPTRKRERERDYER